MKPNDAKSPADRPLFVVGCSRSGTTLLRLMLTCHPDLCIPPESKFIIRLHRQWKNRRIETVEEAQQLCDDLFSDDPKFAEWGLEKQRILDTLRAQLPCDFAAFVAAVYSCYREQTCPQAVRWGDKNPEYVYKLGLLRSLFPEAQFVHIIRDGRAVFSSFLKANRDLGKTYPATPYTAARKWRKALKMSRDFRHDPNYYEMHYEKLVAHPEEELRRLCQFLKIEPRLTEMLAYPQANKEGRLVPNYLASGHAATVRPVESGPTQAWQSELKPQQIAAFELCVGWELESYGYSLVNPAARSKLLNVAARPWQGLFRRLRKNPRAAWE